MRQELVDLASAMLDAGATPEEIKRAVDAARQDLKEKPVPEAPRKKRVRRPESGISIAIAGTTAEERAFLEYVIPMIIEMHRNNMI